VTLGSRSGRTFDVAVVGAGVVGTAIARLLAGYGLAVVIVEAADDVGAGTSKANTAILHTGFDATPGSLESRLVVRGYHLLTEYAGAAGVPLERTGALLVAWTEDELAALPALAAKAEVNGYLATGLIGRDELREREPDLGLTAMGALHVPDEAVVCPWTPPLAFAREALGLGAELILDARVVAVEPARTSDVHLLRTSRDRQVRCRWLVNAAGLYADRLDRLLGHADFTVAPRRGELVVFDKAARELVGAILLPVPTARGKGVLVAPTVFGNVLLGPTAEDVRDPADTASTPGGLGYLRHHGQRILPALLGEEVTAVYAGVRAATEHPDYQIRCHGEQRYVCVGGIRSTGLTASMAIAEHVVGLMRGAGIELGELRLGEPPPVPYIGEARPRPYLRSDLVAGDAAYGTIVCHCEQVTAGEVRDALTAPLPPRTLDGLRRRTRVLNGRCQGFFCGTAIREMLRDGSR
jgi:glycerol-3-phosphate dehydrogenase